MTELKRVEKTKSLPVHSNLRLYNHLQDEDGTVFCNIFRSYVLTDEIQSNHLLFKTYTINDVDWWDNMAFMEYSNPQLWWVIPVANDITNPFEDYEAGQNILILKDPYLYSMFDDIIRLERL